MKLLAFDQTAQDIVMHNTLVFKVSLKMCLCLSLHLKSEVVYFTKLLSSCLTKLLGAGFDGFV